MNQPRSHGDTEKNPRRSPLLRASVSPWFFFRSPRRGFTLTEMMVAIAIVVIVALIGAPLVTTLIGDLQGRGVSGATQLLQSTIALARDRALRDQAPYGLRLVRDEANPWLCTRIQYLQQPPPLASFASPIAPFGIFPWPASDASSDPPFNGDNDGDGLIDESTVDTNGDGIPDAGEVWAFQLPRLSGSHPWFGLIRRGDHLRIDNTGVLYEIVGPDMNPPDGLIDLTVPGNLYPNFWSIWIAAEPFPNREGILGSIDSRGSSYLAPLGTRYQIVRQPVPAGDQEELLLPRSTAIDLLRTKPAAVPDRLISLWGSDNAFGVAGVDDDGNGFVDDLSELGARGSDDVPPAAWPPIDLLFSPQGQLTGEAAQQAVIFFWIGPQGATQNNVAEDLADGRLLSLYTRSGGTQPNAIDSTDVDNNGLDHPYRFAEAAFGAKQ